MTRRTRLFFAVTVGVLVLGISAGLVLSNYGFQNFTLTRPDGPAELAYLPQDASLVAYANVREVMASELRQRLLQGRPADETRADDFEARTGISVERDIERVVASFVPGDEDGRPLVVARGRFDEARIEALILEQGGEVETYGSERLFVAGDEDDPLAIAFVEPGVAVAGSVTAVRRAIDTRASAAASVTENEELMRLVREMQQGTAWAVGRFDAVARERLPEDVSARLPAISWFAASGRINGGLEGSVRAEASTEQAAEDLRQVIQGFVALARLQSGNNPQMVGLLNTLQLGGQGRTVSLSFSLPPELVERLGTANRRRPPTDRNTPPQP